MLGNYVAPVPAQQRVGKHWYLGSANAIYQSLNLIHDERPDIVVVVGADHVYRMDFSQMVQAHIESGAAVHGGRDPPADRARRPVRRDRGRRPTTRAGSARSCEKPTDPSACPTTPTRSWPRWATTSSTPTPWSTRSPGTPTPRTPSTTWAATSCRPSSTRGEATVYDFKDNEVPGRPTATATTGATSARWTPTARPTWTSSRCTRSSTSTTTSGRSSPTTGPTRRPSSSTAGTGEFGEAVNSIVSPGVRRQRGHSSRTRCSRRGVARAQRTTVDDSVLLDGVEVGRHAVVRRAIIDKNVVRPRGAPASASTPRRTVARGFQVTESGLTIVEGPRSR